MSLASGLSVLSVFSKNQLFLLLIFAIVSLISFSYISALTVMISFLLLTLGCFYSSFSSCFGFRVRLSIRCFSCFLRYDCIAINFLLRTAFAESHRFGVNVFSLSFVSKNLLISFLLQYLLRYLVMYCLISLSLCFLQFFFPCSCYIVS